MAHRPAILAQEPGYTQAECRATMTAGHEPAGGTTTASPPLACTCLAATDGNRFKMSEQSPRVVWTVDLTPYNVV